jgi:2',3'-cyclic-nucleotide 2'-phosphodiesterase (5'-nucleotidase family)
MTILPLLASLMFGTADTVKVLLVATTDVHGFVTDWDYLDNATWPGGLARVGTVIDSLRAVYQDQVVLVDAGDVLQGNPFAAYFGRISPRRPHPVVDVMNLLGYDAATPGDHDFDFGLDLFQQAVSDATFPWVSANLRVVPADTLAFHPYVVVQRGPIRVAVAGWLTPGAAVWHKDVLQGHYRVDRIEQDAQRVLGEMRRDADLLVVLNHGGLAGPSNYDTTGVGEEHGAWRFAAGANRPDVVVVGHAHGEIVDTVLGGVHFVEPRPFARSLAVVEVSLVQRDRGWRPIRVVARSLSLERAKPSGRVTRRMGEAHALVTGWAGTVVGESPSRMPAAAARAEDAPLIRFVQDVQRKAVSAELSATPVFDLKAGFEKGEIHAADVYRLYPEEYGLRAVRLSGAALKAYLEQTAWYYYADSTGRVAVNRFVPAANFDVVSGVDYAIDLTRPMGSRITRLTFRGRPVAPTDSFTLAVNSYRQQGGGRYLMLARAPVVGTANGTVRELILRELAKVRAIDPASLGPAAWRIEPEAQASRARGLFVKEGAEPAQAAAAPVVPLLPRPPSRAELAARDSAEKAQYKADSIARAPVASIRQPMVAGRGGSLLRLLADAYRTATRADVAIVALDDAGTALPAGPVTSAQVAAAAGDTRLFTFHVTGQELEAIVENIVSTESPCCEVAGLKVRYDARKKAWDRVREVRFTSGEEPEKKRSYSLVVSGGLAAADSTFTLGRFGCRPDKPCAPPVPLSRWTVVQVTQTPAAILLDYLHRLRQPVPPPDDLRLTPAD